MQQKERAKIRELAEYRPKNFDCFEKTFFELNKDFEKKQFFFFKKNSNFIFFSKKFILFFYFILFFFLSFQFVFVNERDGIISGDHEILVMCIIVLVMLCDSYRTICKLTIFL